MLYVSSPGFFLDDFCSILCVVQQPFQDEAIFVARNIRVFFLDLFFANLVAIQQFVAWDDFTTKHVNYPRGLSVNSDA